MTNDIFLGAWSYRSWLNNPDLSVQPNDLLFGSGTLTLTAAPANILHGTIGGEGWLLHLHGSRSYGNPMEIRFQGKGIVNGEEWIYDYVGYLVPEWPNGKSQRTALVGSIVRAIPHASGSGGVAPAGVVASWYAVKQDPE